MSGTFWAGALELGRDELVVLGPWQLEPGQAVMVQLRLLGIPVSLTARVCTSEPIGATAVTSLRLGAIAATDRALLAATIRAAVARQPRRPQPARAVALTP